tara:strand:+ start:2565 stop:4433 length:1869 start_codon:yes stop_codon:yes gene_type:complete
MANAISNRTDVSELDYDAIRNNLKTFLSNQAEFSDYNFEGSGMSVLLDLLAYNTHYLAYNANMLSNELYLDSADIRKNVVALAKQLGYTPNSPTSPNAVIDITVNDVPATTASITMIKGTTFSTQIDQVSYTFLVNENITATPTDGIYKFSNVNIYEGTSVSYSYTVDSSDVDQKFIIPNNQADTSTLKVKIQESSSDTTTNTYNKSQTLTELDSTSKVYFLQEQDDGRFEVYFGDGVLGKSLTDGNIVILEYIVTNMAQSNGASSFALGSTVGGFTNVSITTVSNAQGGSTTQSNNSIRFNAPLQYQSQNRAVTVKDYETLTQTFYPNAESISAYGGEDAESPVYGAVYIGIVPKSGSTLTETTKTSIVNNLKKYNVASVTPVIVTPETTSIILTTNVKYSENSTTKSGDSIRSNVVSTLTNYSRSNLQKFEGLFRYSQLMQKIDDTDTSILSNITTLKIRKDFTPTLSSAITYNVYYRNALYNPHSGHNTDMGGILESSGFKIQGNDNEMFLNDDGQGNVRMYYLVSGVKTYHNTTQGIINYTTGQVTLTALNIASISNIRGSASTVIELTAKPSSNDVIPVRDQILKIDVANSNVIVDSDSFASGTSDGGTTYTTTSSY